jgi:hypothetical protein
MSRLRLGNLVWKPFSFYAQREVKLYDYSTERGLKGDAKGMERGR